MRSTSVLYVNLTKHYKTREIHANSIGHPRETNVTQLLTRRQSGLLYLVMLGGYWEIGSFPHCFQQGGVELQGHRIRDRPLPQLGGILWDHVGRLPTLQSTPRRFNLIQVGTVRGESDQVQSTIPPHT